MNIGKRIRLNRIFAHPSGHFTSVAVDHFIGYNVGMPSGLRRIRTTLAAIVAGRPDAITMQRGIAAYAWEPHAGLVPLILQSSTIRPDDSAMESIATPEDAARFGADALAVAAFVRNKTEAFYLRTVADCVREASRFEMPVICHIYPRKPDGTISFEPEDVAWAVRCAMEVGVDVVKVPYCGDVEAYRQIVAECPVPVVAAGGPRTKTLEEALSMMAEVVQSGARGATIGRNVWGFDGLDVTAAVRAFKAVIHDGKSPTEALKDVGL